MLTVFELEGYIELIVILTLLSLKGFAFINAMLWSPQAYHAADKWPKQAWLVILGIGLAADVLLMGAGPVSLISLAFTIAAFVYILDVRPALRTVTRR